MENDLTLVVMAGGMGSRFGGLKQIEPMGPNSEFITDYSVYDAILNGFNKVIFIIKRENLEIFQDTIEKRIGNKIRIEYAFQEDNFTFDGEVFKREKPYGTAHAIYSAKDFIDGNFVVINSDDFYGRDAFLVAKSFFDKKRNLEEMGLVGYIVKNTLTENGSVKRGVMYTKDGYLDSLIESKIERASGKLIAEPLNGNNAFEVSDDTLVSMNMLLFTPKIFELIDYYFKDFVLRLKKNPEKEEYLIPDVIDRANKEQLAMFEVIKTCAKWEGVTYKEDKEHVKSAISKLIEEGVYPENLWEK